MVKIYLLIVDLVGFTLVFYYWVFRLVGLIAPFIGILVSLILEDVLYIILGVIGGIVCLGLSFLARWFSKEILYKGKIRTIILSILLLLQSLFIIISSSTITYTLEEISKASEIALIISNFLTSLFLTSLGIFLTVGLFKFPRQTVRR